MVAPAARVACRIDGNLDRAIHDVDPDPHPAALDPDVLRGGRCTRTADRSRRSHLCVGLADRGFHLRHRERITERTVRVEGDAQRVTRLERCAALPEEPSPRHVESRRRPRSRVVREDAVRLREHGIRFVESPALDGRRYEACDLARARIRLRAPRSTLDGVADVERQVRIVEPKRGIDRMVQGRPCLHRRQALHQWAQALDGGIAVARDPLDLDDPKLRQRFVGRRREPVGRPSQLAQGAAIIRTDVRFELRDQVDIAEAGESHRSGLDGSEAFEQRSDEAGAVAPRSEGETHQGRPDLPGRRLDRPQHLVDLVRGAAALAGPGVPLRASQEAVGPGIAAQRRWRACQPVEVLPGLDQVAAAPQLERGGRDPGATHAFGVRTPALERGIEVVERVLLEEIGLGLARTSRRSRRAVATRSTRPIPR